MSRDIVSFYLYRISSRLYFHLPVLFVYFFMEKIAVYQIEILLAVYGVMISLTSQVSAKLLRYMRQKTVIACGEILKALGLVLIIADAHFGVALIGQMICGLGYSVAAGTDSSLLRGICAKLPSGVYQKTESATASYMFLASLFAGIIGSILFGYQMKDAFYAGMLANVVAVFAILYVREERQETTTATNRTADANRKTHFQASQKFWMGYYSLSRAFALAPFVGFLPFFFFTTLHVSLYYFGLVLSLFNIAAFITARFIVRWSNRVRSIALVMGSMAFSVVAMILFGSFDSMAFGLVAITLMGFASGGVRPLTISNLNRTGMNAQERTALLSTMERMYGVFNALLLLIGGAVIQAVGFQPLMIGLAVVYVLSLVLFFLRFGKAAIGSHSENASM